MAIDINQAVNAYSNTARMKSEPDNSLMPGQEADELRPSFTNLLQDSLNEAASQGYKSESLSNLAVAGKAELHELVTAVSNAELTLNAVVAVRDRAVNAYQDILRMPI